MRGNHCSYALFSHFSIDIDTFVPNKTLYCFCIKIIIGMQFNNAPNFHMKYGGTIYYGVNFVVYLTNRVTCAYPNPSANLVGDMLTGTKPRGIGFPVSFFVDQV